MIAGADAVMVGTATMRNPSAAKEIGFELEQFADKIGLERIGDLTGSLNIE